jgi:hypothetical protein
LANVGCDMDRISERHEGTPYPGLADQTYVTPW